MGGEREQNSWPVLGCGLGLRSRHYPDIVEKWPRADWFEAVTENYMDTGGRPLHVLEKIRSHYPVALHGTALSIGSVDPLSPVYLERLKKLIERIDPVLVTDHLCWSGVKGEVLHDLLPLPFTEEAIGHVVSRVGHIQEFLGRRILLENVSTYVTYKHSTMPEWQFLVEIARRSGCGILVDLNNIYVNSFNHGFDPYEYIRSVPGEWVGQIHLAGHTDMGSFLFDTHSAPVIEKVWDLYREALRLWGPVSTLIEWDEDIPSFERLAEEAEKARVIYKDFESASFRGPKAREISNRSEISPRFARRNDSVSSHTQDTTSLLKIQEQMKSRIQPHSASSEADVLDGLLNPQGGVSGVERLSVYANGYVARLREAVSEVYEALHRAMGEETFSEFCRAYAERHPSHDYNLNYAGKNIPEFIGSSARLKEKPFLLDLAKMEWLIWEAFHAFNGTPMRPEDFRGIPMENWERAHVHFQPSVRLFSSAWSVLDAWLARHDSDEKFASSLAKKDQRILIGRRGEQVRCELLNEVQYGLIEKLLAEATLGQVCEEVAGKSSEEIPPITAWFTRWVQDGLITRCEVLEEISK